MAHAKLSPSGASGWLNCPLWPKMKELYEHLDPKRYSDANAQGTIKHAIVEVCLRKGIDPYKFVGKEFRLGDYREDDEDMPEEWADYKYEFTEDDADTIMDALEKIDLYGGEQYIEFRVNTGAWLPGQFGTLDLGAIIFHDDDTITILIWDNKFGRIAVSPVKNDQMRIYGLGFWDNIVRKKYPDLKIREFIFEIFQPMVRGGGGRWKCSLSELLKFGKTVKRRGARALDDDPVAKPGPVQCEWCIGAKTMKCEAYVDYNRDTLKAMMNDDEDLEALVEDDQMPCLKFNGVSAKERTWLIDHFPMLKRFIERLEEEAFDDAYYGREVPGKKLILGNRPRRKFRNVQAATTRIVADLGEEKAYTKKLLSVAQLEKAVGKKNMADYDELIDKGEAKLVLVDENDARPRVKSIRDMFEDEGEA